MTYLTVDGKFNSEAEAIENVLNTQVAKTNPSNGRLPVCMKYQVNSRKTSYGMQMWTLDEIKAGHTYHLGVKCILC